MVGERGEARRVATAEEEEEDRRARACGSVTPGTWKRCGKGAFTAEQALPDGCSWDGRNSEGPKKDATNVCLEGEGSTGAAAKYDNCHGSTAAFPRPFRDFRAARHAAEQQEGTAALGSLTAPINCKTEDVSVGWSPVQEGP